MARVFIIAEAGVNHNGSLDLAKKMVDAAKWAGVDCIKFQTFVSSQIASRHAAKAEYQKQHTNSDETQLEMLKKLELSFDDFAVLNDYCRDRNIEFLSTAFDFDSVDFLSDLGIGKWKIPSGDITNLPYLIKIAKLGRPIMLSTGMSTMQEVRDAVTVLQNNGSGEITVLHCTTEYPAPYGDVNLRAMCSMRSELRLSVGYSDHTNGIEIPIAAVAMGAEVIEKHFTLDRNMEGPDHKASLEPDELRAMVNAIRNVEVALGNGEKLPSASEMKNSSIARKSIIAKRKISKGESFTEDNLTVKRPGSGINPMQWFQITGYVASRDFEEDELIEL